MASTLKNSTFGAFVLNVSPPSLTFGGSSVELDVNAFAILALLASSPGIMLKSDDLLAWPALPDGELDAELTVWVAAINRMFALTSPAFYVAHYPGCGLELIVPAGDVDRPRSASAPMPLVGREGVIRSVASLLIQHRFVTIVGTGGLGKTSVAKAVAHELASRYTSGVCFVDIAPVANPEAVAFAVASALGLRLSGVGPIAKIRQWSADKSILVLLDSCEQWPEAAGCVAEALLSGTAVAVLATSREPLRAGGEWLQRLLPMGIPRRGVPMAASEALRYPAVELFCRRAEAANADFRLQDGDVETVISLCANVDAIPLAIEIVAARAAQFGIHEVSRQVNGHVMHFRGRRRGGPPRHRTLTALLDWSHDLLSKDERVVFRKISVFRASFTLSSAMALVASADLTESDARDCLLDLVAKSLVASTSSGTDVSFRMLDTTRAYAFGKLCESPDRDAVSLRHSQHVVDILHQGELDWELLTRESWLARYTCWIDDVRAGLDWAFSAEGDVAAGIELTIASFALARQMSLDFEFDSRVERALAALAAQPDPQAMPQMRLNAFLGSLRTRVESEELLVISALERALSVAEPAIANQHRVATLSSIWASAVHRGSFKLAAEWSVRIDEVARAGSDPIIDLIAGRIRAQSLHFMGCHADALVAAEQVLANAWRKIPLAYNPSPIELRVSMRIVVARILWLQGYPDQATAMAAQCLEHASTDTLLSKCQALAMGAVPIAMWTGRWDECDQLVTTLGETAVRLAMPYWQHWADRYRDVLAVRGGPARERETVASPDEVHTNLRDHLLSVGGAWLGSESVHRAMTGSVGWCAPEMLRVQAERALVDDPTDAMAMASTMLHHALDLARRQGARSWELRAAMSLARLWWRQGRSADALALLEPILSTFKEGFGSADVMAGMALMDEVIRITEGEVVRRIAPAMINARVAPGDQAGR